MPPLQLHLLSQQAQGGSSSSTKGAAAGPPMQPTWPYPTSPYYRAHSARAHGALISKPASQHQSVLVLVAVVQALLLVTVACLCMPPSQPECSSLSLSLSAPRPRGKRGKGRRKERGGVQENLCLYEFIHSACVREKRAHTCGYRGAGVARGARPGALCITGSVGAGHRVSRLLSSFPAPCRPPVTLPPPSHFCLTQTHPGKGQEGTWCHN